LLSFNELHELLHVLQGIVVYLLIGFALRAVHILMLLTSQVLYNPLHLWREISLGSVEFERLDVPGEVFHIDGPELAVVGRGSLLLLVLFLLLVFKLNELRLVESQLILQNLIDHLELRYFIQVIFH